jgi:hypothetical protein
VIGAGDRYWDPAGCATGSPRREVAVAEGNQFLWRKSSASGTSGCVEVAIIDQTVLMRDSKAPDRAWLRFSLQEWSMFLEAIRKGEFGEL